MRKGIPTKTETYPETPYVSVVIPVYNDGDRLKKCLRALGSQTYPEASYEVIVVDNGSDAPMPSVENYCQQARCIYYPHGGSYAARNAGIKESQGKILAFVDSDCLPSSEWIEHGVKMLGSHDWNIVVGGNVLISYLNEACPTVCELYETVFAFNQRKYVEESNFSVTGNMFTSKQVFAKVGGFNDLLTTGGDTEWGNRAYGTGVQLVYAPNVVVWHPARRSIKQLAVKLKRVTVGQCHLANCDRRYKQRVIIKLIKVLPSIRYKVLPVLRSKKITLSEKMRVLLLIPFWHYYLYWQRLIRIDCLWKTETTPE